MTPSAVLPASIPDSQLGLDASEIRILRQHQQIALSGSVANGGKYFGIGFLFLFLFFFLGYHENEMKDGNEKKNHFWPFLVLFKLHPPVHEGLLCPCSGF
jgi:hypothetical protein